MQISKETTNLKSQFKALRSTQGLCICGLLIAIYVVLSLFNIPVSQVIEIRFGFLVFIAAGMIGGPVMGFTVGFLADVVNCLIRGFAYFPAFSFNYGLLDAVSGLILYRSRVGRSRAVLCALTEYIISVTLSTLWLHIMYGYELRTLIISRFIKCTLSFVVNSILIYVFLEAFQRIAHTALPARR